MSETSSPIEKTPKNNPPSNESLGDSDEKRLVISYKTNPLIKERLKELTSKANTSHIGRVITNADIIEYLLNQKITEADFKEIRESVLTPSDFVKSALFDFNKKNDKNLSIYEFCALQMKLKH